MKNIHLIATNKPSRLIKNNLGYGICPTGFTASDLDLIQAKFVNINITSDEEIKEGDWVYHKVLKSVFKIDLKEVSQEYVEERKNIQKIILTTDQALIADGVQAIDDEFLEWFVKNPSCEFVETERLEDGQYFDYLEDNSVIEGIYENYKIIIPKEEPNPLTVGKEFYESADKNITVYRQETLEEAAERWVFETNGHKWSNNDDTAGDNFASFIAGAKLQAERMYSEEDLLSAFEAGMMFIGEDKGSFREWFEKFKKK
jgi:hypothetical protein